jgi:hypothetical protein
MSCFSWMDGRQKLSFLPPQLQLQATLMQLQKLPFLPLQLQLQATLMQLQALILRDDQS